jgi:tetratricopeptide (TPR) repeat protein
MMISLARQAQGDLAGAIATNAEAKAILENLARSDPMIAVWQRDLSVCLIREGCLLRVQRDKQGALHVFERAHEIRCKLVSNDSSNLNGQHDLSRSLGHLGDLARDGGDLDKALELYRESVDIMERLTVKDPTHTAWRHDLAVFFERMGLVQRAKRHWAEALEFYQQSLEIKQALVNADPCNADWQNILAVSHNQIGDLLRAQGNLEEATQSYRRCLSVRQRMVDANPANCTFNYALGAGHQRMADLFLAQGEVEGALGDCCKSLDIFERLAAIHPDNPRWQLAEVSSLHRMAFITARKGNKAESTNHFRRCHVILARMKDGGVCLDAPLSEFLRALDGDSALNYSSLVAGCLMAQRGLPNPRSTLELTWDLTPQPPPPTAHILDPLSQPSREISLVGLRDSVNRCFQKGLWEAASGLLQELLARGEPLQEVAPKLITCLVSAHEDLIPADAARIEDLLRQLEASGHATLATQLRQQHASKLAPPKKPWWKVW